MQMVSAQLGRGALAVGVMIILVNWITGATGFCQEPRERRIEVFRQKYEFSNVHFDELGVARSATGYLSDRIRDPSKEAGMEAVYRFLEDNKDIFGMTDPRSELILIQGGPRDSLTLMRHQMRFQQFYGGVKVEGAQVIARFQQDLRMGYIESSYVPGIDIDASSNVRADELLSISSTHMGEPVQLRPKSIELVIVQLQDEYRLVWRASTWLSHFPGYSFLIDAHTGEVISATRGMLIPSQASPSDDTNSQLTDKHGGASGKPAPQQPQSTEGKPRLWPMIDITDTAKLAPPFYRDSSIVPAGWP
jgi:hypothetical protein